MIKATDSVEELLEKYPGMASLLMDKGIVCILCGEPFWGELGDLIRNKGKDVDTILAELNAHFDENEQ